MFRAVPCDLPDDVVRPQFGCASMLRRINRDPATSTPVGQNAPCRLCFVPAGDAGYAGSTHPRTQTLACRARCPTPTAEIVVARCAITAPGPGTVLLAVSGLAAHRHKANHLGARVLQFLCHRHNRVPHTWRADRWRPVRQSSPTPAARRRSGRHASSPTHHRHTPWTIGRLGAPSRLPDAQRGGARDRIHQMRWTYQTVRPAGRFRGV
jgi:hypothetical protein